MQEKIEKLIKDFVGEGVRFAVEHPANVSFGDYSTNAGIVSKKPKELLEYLEKNKPHEIEKIEIKNGFINFYLSTEFFSNSVGEIVGNKNFGKNESYKGQKVMVEHTDPNPFKEFHVGHLMPNVIGSTVARIFEWNGGEVKQACYQGDVGLHVAKAVWGMMHGYDAKSAYVFGTKTYGEDEKTKTEIDAINKKIYDRSDEKINELYDSGRKASLEYFDSIYKKLGTHFDYFFFESEVASIGKEIVEKNTGKIFEVGDGGAVIFKAENFDKSLHTRVFINAQGLPTYEAKELGLAKAKYEKYKYDKSVVITGNEINDYFKVLLCAMKQIFPELAEKTTHLSHGMLRLPTGKMSSRTGDVITAESLIDEVKEKTKGDEEVAIGAIKYMILRQSIGGDIIFDIEKSVSTEGDSGVYLQYAYVRANSVLEKAKEEGLHADAKISESWVTTELEKMLYRFPEVVMRSAEEFQPHHIVTFLTELARAFNSFYGNNKIIDKEDSTSSYKLALTKAFSTVMKNGLDILGIPTPKKM